MDLATLSFLERNESILFISRMNGVGKSHIARSLGYIACQKEYKTYYTTCSELINDLNAGVYEKTLGKRMRKYISCDLLIPATECTRANSCKRNTHPRIRNSGNLKKDPPNHRGQKQDANRCWHLVFYAIKDLLVKN